MKVRTVIKSVIRIAKPEDGTAYGNRVYLDHADGYISMYAHLKDISHLKNGQVLEKGEEFAEIGNTGYCPSGAHLHFSLFEPNTTELFAKNTVDPFPYIERLGYPCDTIITNKYGSDIHNSKLKKHEGIDFSSWRLRWIYGTC